MISINNFKLQKSLFDDVNEEINFKEEKIKEMRRNELDLKLEELKKEDADTYYLNDNEKAEYYNLKNKESAIKFRDDIEELAHSIDTSIEYKIDDIELGDEQKLAFNIFEYSIENILFNGCGGTGKSKLIDFIVKNTTKKVVVTSFTGRAALNVGGQTLHSFFQLQARNYLYDEKISVPRKVKDILKELDTLIIDEISMVSANLLDLIDKMCKKARDSILPFGGIQVVCFGDLYQLPPIINKEEMPEYKKRYGGRYFFYAPTIKEHNFKVCELTHIFRQKDYLYKSTLSRIRNGSMVSADLELLNSRVVPIDFKNGQMYLACRKATIKNINDDKLSSLNSSEYIYKAVADGDFKEELYPTNKELKLKVGAQVIFLVNDKDKKWVNGTIATIADLSDNSIMVDIGGNLFKVSPYTWENNEYYFDIETKKIEKKVKGSFTQYPLMLAWGFTIHKSQGQTYDEVIIDFENGTFDTGQAYVALSRCRSLEGLYLKRPIRKNDIKVDLSIKKYLDNSEVIKLSDFSLNLDYHIIGGSSDE